MSVVHTVVHCGTPAAPPCVPCVWLPDIAPEVRAVSVVHTVVHCGTPAVPPCVPCVWPPAVGGAVGLRPCVRVGGQGPRMAPPGCEDCGRNAAVPPQELGGRGVGVEADVRVHAGRLAVPLGACRCSRTSVVVPVVPPRLVTVLPECGPGHCVCQRCVVALRPQASRFAVVAGSTGRFLLQNPQGTSWPAGPG